MSRDKAGNEQVDVLLARFLRATSDLDAERELETLTEKVILPVSLTVLKRHLPQEGESLLSTAALAVTQRLKHWRSQGGEPALRDLEGYVAVVTRNTIDTHLRQSNPEWLLLRNRIRYRFRNDPQLASWEEHGKLACGKVGWQGKRPVRPLPEHTDIYDSELPLHMLCLSLLERAKGPVGLDELATRVGQIYGLSTSVPRSEELLSETHATPENLEAALLQRAYLERLWIEVRLLPSRQAAALLLNLRDAHGRGVIDLLLELGVAQQRELAQIVGWTELELTAVWKRLPIKDKELAALLGATQQQVINLRKVARARLERRMYTEEMEGVL